MLDNFSITSMLAWSSICRPCIVCVVAKDLTFTEGSTKLSRPGEVVKDLISTEGSKKLSQPGQMAKNLPSPEAAKTAESPGSWGRS